MVPVVLASIIIDAFINTVVLQRKGGIDFTISEARWSVKQAMYFCVQETNYTVLHGLLVILCMNLEPLNQHT